MLHDRIKSLRESTGQSAKAFAINSLKMKYTTYYGYENGSREPGSDFLNMFADYFGVTTDYLLCRTSDPHGYFNNEKASAPDNSKADARLKHLCDNYAVLNDEGRDKLVDYSDDLVSGGRYIKDDKSEILEEQA